LKGLPTSLDNGEMTGHFVRSKTEQQFLHYFDKRSHIAFAVSRLLALMIAATFELF
jgi:hypothetical protein